MANRKFAPVHPGIVLAEVLEDLDLVWYEELVLADDLAACAEFTHLCLVEKDRHAPPLMLKPGMMSSAGPVG